MTAPNHMRVRLAEFVKHDSPSGDAEALDTLADVLCDDLADAGATVSREPGAAGDHVVARWRGSGAPGHILVLGHHDTVWPRGTLADWPYAEEGGIASGPGVYDMKAGLVILRTALADLGGRPAHPVVAVVTADEEVGSPDGAQVVRRYLADAVAVFGLEPPHPSGDLKTGRRGVARVRIRVSGREAHSGPDAANGVSAVDELVDQLLAIRTANVPGLAVNVGRIRGGTRANVIAGRAEAEVGLRFDAGAADQALELVQQLTPVRSGAEVTAQVLSMRPAWDGSRRSGLLDHVRAVGERLGVEVAGAPALGAGDTNLPGSRGLPTLDGFGALGGGAHARDEHVDLAGLAPRAALLSAVLAEPLPPPMGSAPRT